MKPIYFKYCAEGIEIQFNTQSFYSCKSGSDLADFDALLEYYAPEIDLSKISARSARHLEQKLYRTLSKCRQQRTARKAFAGFIKEVKTKFSKKSLLNEIRKLFVKHKNNGRQRLTPIKPSTSTFLV